MPVLNPDGYQYTFDTERLWRKNLRDNNGDGQISVGDGVDPNRNFPSHWGYDNEGSSPITSSETYRGPSAASEPETKAMVGLFGRIGFAFMVNYHSNGQWLLYNDGWQIGTPTADDPIYYALSGNLDKPAIEGFHPGLSSDVLYVTNGEIDGYAQEADGTLSWTPELSPGCDGCGFVFPDDQALVQAEFERNLPFAQSVADSAVDPGRPEDRHRHQDQAVLRQQRGRLQERHPGRPAQLHQVVRRPAAGRRARQAQPRRGHREVPHQRRRDALGAHEGVGGRVALRHDVDALPPDARRRHRHQPGRHGRGVVRGRRPARRRRSPTRR